MIQHLGKTDGIDAARYSDMPVAIQDGPRENRFITLHFAPIMPLFG